MGEAAIPESDDMRMQGAPAIDDEFTPLPSPQAAASARCSPEVEVPDVQSATISGES